MSFVLPYSDPFVFAERAGLPAKSGDGLVQLVREKWVYVFDERGGLRHELYVYEDGRLFVAGDEDLVKRRSLRTPLPQPPSEYAPRFFRFALQPAGVVNFHVLVSPLRLPLDVLIAYRSAPRKYLPQVLNWSDPPPQPSASAETIHAAADMQFAQVPNPLYVEPDGSEEPEDEEQRFFSKPEISAVVGYDPIAIAQVLAKRYRESNNTFLRWLRNKSLAKPRLQEFFTQTLLNFLLKNTGILDKVHNDLFEANDPDTALITTVLRNMPGNWTSTPLLEEYPNLTASLNYLGKAHADRSKRIMKRERAAARLTAWLDSDLVRMIEEAYLSREDPPSSQPEPEPEDPAHWLAHYALLINDLSHSALGSVWLMEQVDPSDTIVFKSESLVGQPTALAEFVLHDTAIDSSTRAFKTSRFAAKSVVSIFNEVVVPMIHGAPLEQTLALQQLQERVAGHAARLFPSIADAITAPKTTLEIPYGTLSAVKRPVVKTFSPKTITLKAIKSKLTQALKDDKVTTKLKVTFSGVTLGLDWINTALALRALDVKLKQDPNVLFSMAGLGTAVSVVSTASKTLKFLARDTLEEVVKHKLDLLGGLGSVYYVFADLKDARSKYSRGDNDAAVFSAVAAVGEGIGVCAAYLVLTGSQLGGPVGFVGGLIAATGYIVGGLLTDSDMELLVSHCIWGIRNFRDDDDHPSWSPVKLRDLADDPKHQVRALHNLAFSFGVTVKGTYMSSGVRIFPGQLDPSSKVHITWAATQDPLKKGDPYHESERREWVLKGAKLFDAIKPFEGRATITTFLPQDLYPPPESGLGLRFVTVWVRIDAFGDGEVMLPTQGALRYDLERNFKTVDQEGIFLGWPNLTSSGTQGEDPATAGRL